MFCLAVVAARGEAQRWAFQLTVPFPAYDDEAIYRQIRGRVFSKSWLASALAGSTLVAFAMLQSNEVFAVALMMTGIVVIVLVSSVQGYRLFHVAVNELDLPWPPVEAPI